MKPIVHFSSAFFLFLVCSLAIAQNKSTKENHAPVFVKEMPDTTIRVGKEIQFSYKAIDSDGDSVKYFAKSLFPANSFVNSTDGKFIWRPSLLQLGKNYIQVHATDGKDTILSRIAIVTVLDATTSDGGFRLFVDTKPAEGGLVLRSFTSSSATLIARANEGYRFTNWSNENSVLSSDSIYSFPIKSNLFENDRANIYANFRVNHAPVFVKEMPDTTLYLGQVKTYAFKAVDPDGDSIKYLIHSDLMSDFLFQLDSLTGYFVCRPFSRAQGKSYLLIIGASDGKLETLSRTTIIYVYATSTDEENIPSIFSLSQNYPNPFNPETTIEYSIPVETRHASSLQKVTLKVYDVLGREVATLVDEYKQPGQHNCKWRIENGELPSGVYFYRLQSGSFIDTKKLVLIK